MSNQKLRLGVVGCGYVAVLDYFPVLARADVRERIDLVTVCDVQEKLAKEAQERFGARRSTTDYQRVIGDPEIDAVALLTPIPFHYDQAGEAIEVEADDNTVFNLDFGDACFGQVDSSYQIVKSETPQIEIYGTKGTISAQGWSWSRHPRPLAVWTNEKVEGLVQDSQSGWWVLPPDRPKADPQVNHTMLDLLHFTDCLLDGVEPINTPEHARHVIEIIEKGYESAKTGQRPSIETTPGPVPALVSSR